MMASGRRAPLRGLAAPARILSTGAIARSVPKSATDLQLFELKGELTHLAKPEEPGAPNHDGMVCTQTVQILIVNYSISGHPQIGSGWEFSGCPEIIGPGCRGRSGRRWIRRGIADQPGSIPPELR